MLKLLMGSAAIATVLLLTQPTKAAIVGDLGINPTSAQGDFSNSVGGAVFTDQFTFQLVGGPQFIAIGSATNVYTQPSDFITGFTGQLFSDVGAAGPSVGDIAVSGAFAAIACPSAPTNCQLLAGSALLNPGNYYLQIAGTGGGTSGYGGNLTTLAVPSPVLGGGLPGLIMTLAGFLGYRRWRTA